MFTMTTLGRIAAVGGGALLAAGGAAYAFGGESPLDVSTPTRRVAGFAAAGAGLLVASTALPAALRFGIPRGPLGPIADSGAGRALLVGVGATLAGIGMSHAFANDFPVGDMTNEGHHETGFAALGLGVAVAAHAALPTGGTAGAVRTAATLGGVIAAGWFGGSTVGDYASAALRAAPPTDTPLL